LVLSPAAVYHFNRDSLGIGGWKALTQNLHIQANTRLERGEGLADPFGQGIPSGRVVHMGFVQGF
jgi:hypothetical protein